MARRLALFVVAIIVLCLAYLFFWPVSISPVAWNAPPDPGLNGLFAANDILARAKRLPLEGGHEGPVAAVTAPGGDMFIATVDGHILRLDATSAQISEFADTQGLPLGLALSGGNLLIADARRGLLAADMEGNITVLAEESPSGKPLGLLTGIAATPDGAVYLSEAAPERPADAAQARRIAYATILQHRAEGRILAFDTKTGKMSVFLEGLHFPAGLALTRDAQRLLIAAMGSYRVMGISLIPDADARAGALTSSLPGFPANIDRASDGTFWLGLVASRSPTLDRLSARPFLRKLLWRLPSALRPDPRWQGVLVHFDEDGNILETLNDSTGTAAYLTGAVEGPENLLFVTSFTGGDIAVLPR